jgi:hypothetical protein
LAWEINLPFANMFNSHVTVLELQVTNVVVTLQTGFGGGNTVRRTAIQSAVAILFFSMCAAGVASAGNVSGQQAGFTSAAVFEVQSTVDAGDALRPVEAQILPEQPQVVPVIPEFSKMTSDTATEAIPEQRAPEPMSLALFGTGMLGIFGLTRTRRSAITRMGLRATAASKAC